VRSRLKLNDLLMQLDYPGRERARGQRSIHHDGDPEAFRAHSPFMIERAQGLQRQLTADTRAPDAAR